MSETQSPPSAASTATPPETSALDPTAAPGGTPVEAGAAPPADPAGKPAGPVAKPAPPPPLPPPAELLAALARLEAGDFRAARAEAQAILLVEQRKAEVSEAARDLLRQLAPDPWALRIGVLAGGLLLLIIITYVF